MPCSVCNKAINRNSLKVCCVTCKLVFHALCLNLTESEVEFLSDKSAFICEKCINAKKLADRQTGINASFSNNQLSTPTANSSSENDEPLHKTSFGNESNKITIEEVHILFLELKSMLNKTDENVNKLSVDLTAKVTNLEKLVTSKMGEIINENNIMKTKLSDMQIKIDKLDYVLNKKCLEFRGLPESVTKSPIESVKKVLNLGLKIDNINNEQEIINECWLNKKKNIVVRFSDYSFVNKILKLKKSCRENLNTKTIFATAKSTNVYVNEIMSLNQKKLLYEAKEFNKKNELNYKFIWFSYGSVKMRKSETADDHIKIECLSDLKKLINDKPINKPT